MKQYKTFYKTRRVRVNWNKKRKNEKYKQIEKRQEVKVKHTTLKVHVEANYKKGGVAQLIRLQFQAE